MEKLDFLALTDEKVISFLKRYKEEKSLSYEGLALRIGCHREALSKFMHGKGAGSKIRRLAYERCTDNIYTDSVIQAVIFSSLLSDNYIGLVPFIQR